MVPLILLGGEHLEPKLDVWEHRSPASCALHAKSSEWCMLFSSGSQPTTYGSTHIPAENVDDDAHSSDSENGTFVEEGKYNEDGSFIGQYSTPDKLMGVQNGRYFS